MFVSVLVVVVCWSVVLLLILAMVAVLLCEIFCSCVFVFWLLLGNVCDKSSIFILSMRKKRRQENGEHALGD